MMKRVLCGIAALFSTWCSADDLELGAGITRFSPPGNGIWYQKGFPYKLHMTSPSFKLGLTGKPFGGWRWHGGWEYLGKYGSEAKFVASDSNYNLETQGCNGPCMPLSYGEGDGKAHGFYLSAGPEYQRWGLIFHPQIGVYAYRPTWKFVATEWKPCYEECTAFRSKDYYARGDWNASYLVGVSVGDGTWDVGVNMRLTSVLRANEVDNYPSVTNGRTLNVSVTRRF